MRFRILGSSVKKAARLLDLFGFGFSIIRGLSEGSRLKVCINFYFFSVLIFLILLLGIIVEFLGFYPSFDFFQELWLISGKQRMPEGVTQNLSFDFPEPIDIKLY